MDTKAIGQMYTMKEADRLHADKPRGIAGKAIPSGLPAFERVLVYVEGACILTRDWYLTVTIFFSRCFLL
jgi:hypothetical protein